MGWKFGGKMESGAFTYIGPYPKKWKNGKQQIGELYCWNFTKNSRGADVAGVVHINNAFTRMKTVELFKSHKLTNFFTGKWQCYLVDVVKWYKVSDPQISGSTAVSACLKWTL